MYDLAWSRATAKALLMLCTRTQQLEALWAAYQQDIHKSTNLYSLEDGLAYLLARSHRDKASALAWNRLKAWMKGPPCRPLPDLNLFHVMARACFRGGRAWIQKELENLT